MFFFQPHPEFHTIFYLLHFRSISVSVLLCNSAAFLPLKQILNIHLREKGITNNINFGQCKVTISIDIVVDASAGCV